MSISGNEIARHIVIHEILGVTSGGGGSGELTIVSGVPVFQDPTRGNKQMSISRIPFEASKKGNVADTYLQSLNGIANSLVGNRMPYAGTIVSMTVQNDRSNTFLLRIRKNGSLTNLATLTVSSALGATDISTNVDFSAGDLIEFYIEGTSNSPIARIEVCWRP